jgi:hypothetical protein
MITAEEAHNRAARIAQDKAVNACTPQQVGYLTGLILETIGVGGFCLVVPDKRRLTLEEINLLRAFGHEVGEVHRDHCGNFMGHFIQWSVR